MTLWNLEQKSSRVAHLEETVADLEQSQHASQAEADRLLAAQRDIEADLEVPTLLPKYELLTDTTLRASDGDRDRFQSACQPASQSLKNGVQPIVKFTSAAHRSPNCVLPLVFCITRCG